MRTKRIVAMACMAACVTAMTGCAGGSAGTYEAAYTDYSSLPEELPSANVGEEEKWTMLQLELDYKLEVEKDSYTLTADMRSSQDDSYEVIYTATGSCKADGDKIIAERPDEIKKVSKASEELISYGVGANEEVTSKEDEALLDEITGGTYTVSDGKITEFRAK